MKLHCIHVIDKGKKYWLVCDNKGERHLKGVYGQDDAVKSWMLTYEVPESIITHRGIHTLAEAATTIADLVLEAQEKGES